MRQICDMASGLASYAGQYLSKICKQRSFLGTEIDGAVQGKTAKPAARGDKKKADCKYPLS